MVNRSVYLLYRLINVHTIKCYYKQPSHYPYVCIYVSVVCIHTACIHIHKLAAVIQVYSAIDHRYITILTIHHQSKSYLSVLGLKNESMGLL